MNSQHVLTTLSRKRARRPPLPSPWRRQPAARLPRRGNEEAVRDDGSIDFSKVTLSVGDQKGGSKALLQAAGDLDKLPYKIDLEGVHLRSAAARGPQRRRHRPRRGRATRLRSSPPPPRASSPWSSGETMGAEGRHDRGAQGLLSSRTSADLKGKTVAVAKGSSANYNLLAQLDEGRARLRQGHHRQVPAAGRRTGGVLAARTWTPGRSGTRTPRRPRCRRSARILVDGRGVVNGLTFQAANPDALDDKATRRAIKDYLERLRDGAGLEQRPSRPVGKGLVRGDRAAPGGDQQGSRTGGPRNRPSWTAR